MFNRVHGHLDSSVDRFYHNYIDLRFEHSVYVSAVYIYETFNPGSVFAVWAGKDLSLPIRFH